MSVSDLERVGSQIYQDRLQFTRETLVYTGTLKAQGVPEPDVAAKLIMAALTAWWIAFNKAKLGGFPDTNENQRLVDTGNELHNRLIDVHAAAKAKSPGALMTALKMTAQVAGSVVNDLARGAAVMGERLIGQLEWLSKSWVYIAVGVGVLYFLGPTFMKMLASKRA